MKTIHELLRTAVSQHSARIAFIEPEDEGRMVSLTYNDLLERAHGFAGALHELGLQKGDRLLLWSASRIDWMAAFLGAMLIGAVVVPLDINSKEDFLSKIEQSTEAKYLITSQKQYSGLKQSHAPLIDIDALPQSRLDMATLPEINGDDLAELVFTSGTTGQPKGVMLSHLNITSDAIASVSVVNILKDDRALSILPLSHMFELTIEIAILYVGASVVYARTLSPDTLLKLLVSQHFTCMVLVPHFFNLSPNTIKQNLCQHDDLT